MIAVVRKMLAVLATLIVVACAGAAGAHIWWQSQLYGLIAKDSRAAAALLSVRAPRGLATCDTFKALRRDEQAVVRALFTLERFAQSPIEAGLERVTVTAARWLRTEPPDWTYGPGQIRLSRAGDQAPMRSRWNIASDLINACASVPYAIGIIRQAQPGREVGDGDGPLSREAVMRIAARYNGVLGQERSQEAVLSAAIYQTLAYELVLHGFFDHAGRSAFSTTGRP